MTSTSQAALKRSQSNNSNSSLGSNASSGSNSRRNESSPRRNGDEDATEEDFGAGDLTPSLRNKLSLGGESNSSGNLLAPQKSRSVSSSSGNLSLAIPAAADVVDGGAVSARSVSRSNTLGSPAPATKTPPVGDDFFSTFGV